MNTEIQKVKKEIRIRNWAAEIEACKNSGMTVRSWCSANGVNPKTYYTHLRKVQEYMLEAEPAAYQNIVPIGAVEPAVNRIEITAGRIQIRMPDNISPELLLTLIGGLDHAR